MSAAAQISVEAPATGQSFECWLNEELSVSGTGGGGYVALTYYLGDSDYATILTSLADRRHEVTDPAANSRFKHNELFDWTRNLHQLSTVAAEIFPGIRPLTEPEQRNLRGLYRKLYRKV